MRDREAERAAARLRFAQADFDWRAGILDDLEWQKHGHLILNEYVIAFKQLRAANRNLERAAKKIRELTRG